MSVESPQECTTLMRHPKGAARFDARQCDGRRSPSTTDVVIADVDEPTQTDGPVTLQRVICHSAMTSVRYRAATQRQGGRPASVYSRETQASASSSCWG
jgi:hypothetical protein